MDDDRRPDQTTRLLEEFVHHVSGQVTVPPSPADQQSQRRRPRSAASRRGPAIALAAAAAVGASVLVVAYGPRSQPISPHPLRPAQSTLGTSVTNPVATVDGCTAAQLTATVDFNQTGTDPGAIKLTNTGDRACSLSGQPAVVVVDGSGGVLALNESVFHQAPDWPPPSSAIVLSAAQALPQAIVQFDWTWCGVPPGKMRFQIRFQQWPSPLTVANAGVSPPGFVPATCTDTSDQPLLAVDYVRGFGGNGIIPGPYQPTPVLGADAIGTVTMGTSETRAVATIERTLGPFTSTGPGACPGRTEVEWDDLSLEFSSGRLDGYRYTTRSFAALGTEAPPVGAPEPPLKTATGATLGMTLVQVRTLYPPGAFSEEQGGAVVVPGVTSGHRLFLGFFESAPSTPLTEIKGGGPCGDV